MPNFTPPHISDTALLALANPRGGEIYGDWDPITRAFLAACLPDLAQELLRHRQADRATAATIPTRLSAAHAAITAECAPSRSALIAACETLALHSNDTETRAAAADVLAQMQEAA